MEPSSYASEKKGKNGIKRIINAFGYSKDGLAAAYRYESAFRQVFWLNLILIVLALFLDFGSVTKMVLVVASFISLITELFNTAIERLLTIPLLKNTSWPSVPKMPVRLRN